MDVSFNRVAAKLFRELTNNNVFGYLLLSENNYKLPIVLAGLLSVLTDANNIVRFFIRKLGKDLPEMQNEGYIKAGRVIGILERLLFFFFAFKGEYSAIGFVLAAKGIIRIKEIEGHSEYLLIGTGISLIYSIFIARLVGALIFN
jgi:hypothetical protein